MGESPIFLIELLITKLTRQVCIINTYSTYRTSSICIHTATSPPQAPFVVTHSVDYILKNSRIHGNSKYEFQKSGIPISMNFSFIFQFFFISNFHEFLTMSSKISDSAFSITTENKNVNSSC